MSKISKEGILYRVENRDIADGTYIVPSHVKIIAQNAFLNCTDLEEVIMDNSVNEIWHGAFRNCINLKTISIPRSVKKIYERTFENCKSLEEITIPADVEKVFAFAFKDCFRLKKITAYENTSIHPTATIGCDSLNKNIQILPKVKNIVTIKDLYENDNTDNEEEIVKEISNESIVDDNDAINTQQEFRYFKGRKYYRTIENKNNDSTEEVKEIAKTASSITEKMRECLESIRSNVKELQELGSIRLKNPDTPNTTLEDMILSDYKNGIYMIKKGVVTIDDQIKNIEFYDNEINKK